LLREAAPQASCLYAGSIAHQRYEPIRHAFRYRVSLLFLDLDELPHLSGLGWLWGYEKRAPLSFRRADYFGDPSVPLETAVRDLVEARSGRRPSGPIRLLTSPRTFGYCFNPASFYFCYDASGEVLEHVVAEVTNTPWLERHCYVLTVPAERVGHSMLRFVTEKALHVSPFLGMQQSYDWQLRTTGDHLWIRITNRKGDAAVFEAQMSLTRQSLSLAGLCRNVLFLPLAAYRIVGAIYFEALRLWWKGAPYHPHPGVRPHDAAFDANDQPQPTEPRTHDNRQRAA
jgi:uncharacterized protein